jgi:membrane protein implicated in regulation of membrane protease activity
MFRLILGAGFIVLAVLILMFGNAALFFGWFGLIIVLLTLGVALIVTAYLEPKLSEKKKPQS